MRLLRLELLRYGPFTNKVLKLRQGAKLHLIFGPNEAGKSSSLAAIGDLLFGFPKRKEYDFLHEAQTLRVGAEILSRSGEALSFRRRRGNKKTLLSNDDAETALQDDALAPFLGNLGRDVFSRAFGLDSETLRQGGEAMLESEGEMGAALFAAASGLTGLARIRRNLEAEADAIFAPRASRERVFYQALGRYEAAIADERRSELKSGEWKALVTDITEIERQIADIKVQRAEVAAALSRLQRLKVLEPILAGIDQVGRDLQAFADLPEVTPAFLAECQAATEAAENARAGMRAAADEVAAATAVLESIAVDEQVSAWSAKITDLFSRKGDYLSKLAEFPRIEAERDELTATLADLARRLGFPDPDEMVRRMPSAAVLENLRELAEEGASLESEIAAEERRLEEEKAALRAQEAQNAISGLTDPKPWRDQLAALAPDLKELAEQSSLEAGHLAMLDELRERTKRLVPQVADLAELGGIVLPTRQMIAGHKAVFDRILEQGRAEAVRLENNTRQRDELLEKLAEIEQSGPTAYEETIGVVRAERDATFALLRNHLLRTGRLMTSAEVAEKLVQYEEESAEADSIADRAIADADRISRLASYREQLGEVEGQRPPIEQRLDELAVEQEQAVEDYAALFATLGVSPMSPEAMITWVGEIEDLLAMRRDAAALDARITGLYALGEQIHGVLVAIAHGIGIAGVEQMPPLALSRLISTALEEMAGRWSARLTGEGARQAARVRIAQIEDILGKARQRHRDWRQRFDALLPALGLRAGSSPAGAVAALNIWRAVPDASRERSNRAVRVDAMQRDIGAYEEDVLSLTQRLVPVLADLPVQGLIDVLREQAETARAARARQEDARARLELAENRLEAARIAHEASSAALDALASMLPEGADMRAELNRFGQRDRLRGELAARRRDFEAHADGYSEAAVRTELPGFDRDRAALDAEDLERRSDGLHVDNNRLHALLGQKQAQREALEAGTGSEFAAFERQSAEAEIVATARAWAVRKIAAVMLGAAIDRHREAQSDPLMLRAGALFSTLTGGSFSGLLQDYGEDDQPRLIGVRKSGEHVAIAGMSEGTRDQLYLALRLAYIEDYADRTEPIPFIGDDIFQTFDDERTAAGIEAFASTSALFQPILFTHHFSVVSIARRTLGEDLDYLEL